MAFRRRRETAPPAGGGSRGRALESAFIRSAMTLGIIGIGTAVAAVMGTQDIRPWVIGVVVSTLSVLLAAVLWTRRRL
jgi:hypothetical protein